MEREYTRIRNAEKRYRMLFQLASEAVLIVDSNTGAITEANPAAATLLGVEPKRLIGQAFEELFAEPAVRRSAPSSPRRASRRASTMFMSNLGRDQTRRSADRLALPAGWSRASACSPRRLGDGAVAISNEDASLLRLVEAMPEAFVVIDADRRVLTANAAFLDLVQATTLLQVRGTADRALDRTSGRGDRRPVRQPSRPMEPSGIFSTIARGEFGTNEDVEIVARVGLGRPVALHLA